MFSDCKMQLMHNDNRNDVGQKDDDYDDGDLGNDEEMRAGVANGQCSAPLSSTQCQQQLGGGGGGGAGQQYS